MKISIYLKWWPMIAAWSQRSKYWRHGFVLRLMWLGIAVRWGRRDLEDSIAMFLDLDHLDNPEDFH